MTSAADVTASAAREKRNIHLHGGEVLAETLISSRRAGDGEGGRGGKKNIKAFATFSALI